MARPERVSAIISRNGNAYEEGLGDAWAPIQRYWSSPTTENRGAIREGHFALETHVDEIAAAMREFLAKSI
jgi:hypothetical protein